MGVRVVESGLDRWGAPWQLCENEHGFRWLCVRLHPVPHSWFQRFRHWLTGHW